MKTLGEFYREKVLCLSEESLIKKEFEDISGELKLGRELYGWKLYADRKIIDCNSEAEARYLLVFLDAGMREILIPKDEKYLQSLLSELEYLKRRIDEIINSYLETILNRKIRERLKYEVYQEITK